VIAVDGARLAGPRIGDDQIAFAGAFEHRACRPDDLRDNAENGRVAEPGFWAIAPGSGVIRMPPVLGLPPGVDDRAAAIADDAVIPFQASGLIGSPTEPSSLSEARLVLFTGASPRPSASGSRSRGVENVDVYCR